MQVVPIALGYYANEAWGCADPHMLTKIESDRMIDIYVNDSDEVDIWETRFSGVTGPTSEGYYDLEFALSPDDAQAAAEDETFPTGIAVRPLGRGRIEIVLQDFSPMVLCEAKEIPARMRR